MESMRVINYNCRGLPNHSNKLYSRPVVKEIFNDQKADIAVICVTKSRTGDYDFRACARARGFRGSTFSVGRIRFAVCAERSRDKTCVF